MNRNAEIASGCAECGLVRMCNDHLRVGDACGRVKQALRTITTLDSTNHDMVRTHREAVVKSLEPHEARFCMYSAEGQCIGGDGVEVTKLIDGHLIFMYDINGHGVRSAREHARFSEHYRDTLFRRCRTGEFDAFSFFQDVNFHIEGDDMLSRVEGMFVHVNQQQQTLSYACFGGMRCFYKPCHGSVHTLIPFGTDAHNFLLGASPTLTGTYETRSYTPGDSFLMYSDGIPYDEMPEIASQAEKQYESVGFDGVHQLVQDFELWEKDDVTLLDVKLS